MEVLPEVAKSFTQYCKKCEADRYHLVLAHKTDHSAKVECEVCKKKSTFSLLKKRVNAYNAKKTAKTAKTKWSDIESEIDKDNANPYSIKNDFEENTTIEHPKFGFGYITKKEAQKIEVVFEDGLKSLVHNR